MNSAENGGQLVAILTADRGGRAGQLGSTDKAKKALRMPQLGASSEASYSAGRSDGRRGRAHRELPDHTSNDALTRYRRFGRNDVRLSAVGLASCSPVARHGWSGARPNDGLVTHSSDSGPTGASPTTRFTIGEAPYPYTMDVDHVAVGPSGVLVIETKYSLEQIDSMQRLASKICRRRSRPVKRQPDSAPLRNDAGFASGDRTGHLLGISPGHAERTGPLPRSRTDADRHGPRYDRDRRGHSACEPQSPMRHGGALRSTRPPT